VRERERERERESGESRGPMYLPDDASGLDVGDGAAATEGVGVLALGHRRVCLVERRGACPGKW
jgi:hypothetical protein